MRLRQTQNPIEDCTPVAVVWRPVCYYASDYIESSDDFDTFTAACYSLGNVVFDIRRYNGHPEKTSSLYIPFSTPEGERRELAKRALSALCVPTFALGWFYGEPYEDGYLARNPKDKIRERELGIICLKICYSNSGDSTLDYIREFINENYALSAADLKPATGRGSEPRWWEILRNIHKHRGSFHNILNQNLATYENRTFTLTPEGRKFLQKIGYAPNGPV